MMEEEFSRLMKLFQEAAEGKEVNLEELFKEALNFFVSIKECMTKGTPEEKQAGLQMVTRMHQEMTKASKRIAEKAGMTEEQLSAFSENPSNFTKEQWALLQKSREEIRKTGSQVEKEVLKSGSHQPQIKGQQPPEDEHTKRFKDKQLRHSKWIRP